MTRPTGTAPSAKGPSVDLNDPIVGWYRRRLVRQGPFVPARIWLADGDRDPETGELVSDQKLLCQVWDGHGPQERDVYDEWSYLAGNPITEAEFNTMVATMDWARNTVAPEGDPRTRIDLTRTPPIFIALLAVLPLLGCGPSQEDVSELLKRAGVEPLMESRFTPCAPLTYPRAFILTDGRTALVCATGVYVQQVLGAHP